MNSYKIFRNFFRNNKIIFYDNDRGMDQSHYVFKQLKRDKKPYLGCDYRDFFYRVYNKSKMTELRINKLTTNRKFDRIKAYADHFNDHKNYIYIEDINNVDMDRLKKFKFKIFY